MQYFKSAARPPEPLDTDKTSFFNWYMTKLREPLLSRFSLDFKKVIESTLAEMDLHCYRQANRYLWDTAEAMRGANAHRAYDHDELTLKAREWARRCSRLDLDGKKIFTRSKGVQPPEGKRMTDVGCGKRMSGPEWWSRKLRVKWVRETEDTMRRIGVIRKGVQVYASDDAVKFRRKQKRAGQDFLKSRMAVSDSGEQLELWDISQRSISNPAIRRMEFMTRVRGFEEISHQEGHVAEFVTLTAPSTFHAQVKKAGRNPKYLNQAVRDAHAWMTKMWARARAKLKKLSIIFYGFRIAEPHHDGTPHWHLLVFGSDNNIGVFREVVRGMWLSEHGEESGAQLRRCEFQPIDQARGSAVGYIAKYVSKNIDGAGGIGDEEDFETGAVVSDSVERVETWARTFGIRQFQQFGGPPVGLYREVRRLRDAVVDGKIEAVRSAADAGDFRGFINAAGGIFVGRKTCVVLEKEVTGELNKYDEMRAPQTVGVRSGDIIVKTRPHVWRIEKKEHSLLGLQSSSCISNRQSPGMGNDSFSSVFSDLGPVGITVADEGWSDLEPGPGIAGPDTTGPPH